MIIILPRAHTSKYVDIKLNTLHPVGKGLGGGGAIKSAIFFFNK